MLFSVKIFSLLLIPILVYKLITHFRNEHKILLRLEKFSLFRVVLHTATAKEWFDGVFKGGLT